VGALVSDNLLLAAIPPPSPVDEIRYERAGEVETMTLRAGRWFVKWPYTLTDCYVVRHIRVSLFSSKAVRVLSPEKLEAKRREMFRHAYEEFVRTRGSLNDWGGRS
jgi:hypothetical protein